MSPRTPHAGNFKKGVKPWNWRGEPIVEPRGYVLIFVGKDHPLADCRGYAYQHRLVAAEEHGISEIYGKHIHHENETKDDNSDKNLTPLTVQEHRARHRKRTDLKPVGAINPEIPCACGCGALLLKYDSHNRPRRFFSGHNTAERNRRNGQI